MFYECFANVTRMFHEYSPSPQKNFCECQKMSGKLSSLILVFFRFWFLLYILFQLIFNFPLFSSIYSFCFFLFTIFPSSILLIPTQHIHTIRPICFSTLLFYNEIFYNFEFISRYFSNLFQKFHRFLSICSSSNVNFLSVFHTTCIGKSSR